MNLVELKRVAVAAMIACAPLASFAGGGTVDPSPSASFSNTVTGAFEDIWTFSLGTPSIVAASLTNVEVSFSGGSTVGGIVDFSAWLNGTQIVGPTSSVTVNGITVTTKVLAGGDRLGPGTFELKVSGSGITGASASYGGNLVATPVPEPETYALMLAGLGALGFLARRRIGS